VESAVSHVAGKIIDGFSRAPGLYDPKNEHDACGVGFVAHIKGAKSHEIITQALEILKTLTIAAPSVPTRCWATARAS
jgi:hypothetical protein